MTRPAALALSVLLLAQAAAYHLLPKTERSFVARPLSEFPEEFNGWRMSANNPIEEEVQKVLKADDSLNRLYVGPGAKAPISLFVAFFRSQTSGVAPHSPKNCLPGSGYAPLSSGTLAIQAGADGEVEVNRYVVARGESKSLVLYWYQTPKRIVASEYAAKFWLAVDSIRYRRSDTTLVRIVVPYAGDGEAEAEAKAFVRDVLPMLNAFLPRLDSPAAGRTRSQLPPRQ